MDSKDRRRHSRDIARDRVEVRTVRPRRVLYAIENSIHTRKSMVNDSQFHDPSMDDGLHRNVGMENIPPNLQYPFGTDRSTQNSVIRSSATQPSQYFEHRPRCLKSIPSKIVIRLDFQSTSMPDVGCSSHVNIEPSRVSDFDLNLPTQDVSSAADEHIQDPFTDNEFNNSNRSVSFFSGSSSMQTESHLASGPPNTFPTSSNHSDVGNS